MELVAGQSIKVHLLGKFRITTADGRDITPTATKARCIFVMLVLAEKGVVSRDKVASLLWSRHAKEQSRTSLRQSLRVLKQTFEEIDSLSQVLICFSITSISSRGSDTD